MRTDDFDYELPPELIAQTPPAVRGSSRMLVLDPKTGDCRIVPFEQLPEYLQAGDAIAVNNTKVIRARIYASKDTGARIEIFLLSLCGQDQKQWTCMIKGARRVKPGTDLLILHFDGTPSRWHLRVLEKEEDSGECRIEFACDDPDAVLRECGHLPLPPYIRRPDAPLDSERYQTIYAHEPGAVAAPTAGLHFTETTFRHLREKGVERVELTLHVGAGTFKPVSAECLEDHKMHVETYEFPEGASARLNAVRGAGNRILAVGTTSLRTLETCVDKQGEFHAGSGETGIFIYPPYRICSADMLLTNFHLPKSTLLMLVSAFAGVENIRKAYALAVAERMRFFSYGDCMLITSHI